MKEQAMLEPMFRRERVKRYRQQTILRANRELEFNVVIERAQATGKRVRISRFVKIVYFEV